MTVLNTGSTEEYAKGWENIFGGKPRGKKSAAAQKSPAPGKKKIGKKPAKKVKAKR